MPHVATTSKSQSHLAWLAEMREFGGDALTTGLADAVIRDFIDSGFSELADAIEQAYARFVELRGSHSAGYCAALLSG